MKLFGLSINLKSLFSRTESDTSKKERYITDIIRTHAFSKLSVQDKVLSLGRLIVVFRADFGFTPRSLEKTMKVLNVQVKNQSDQAFRVAYKEARAK